ncbi:MAG: TRAP transporter small permease subunit [Lachnospiraceae bacterium]|nr:TRAP transporter small permease subunit [Lachnospiraceae bacterium]
MRKLFDKIVKIYTEVLCAFGGVFYITFCVCVLVQIFSRNFLPKAPSWTEEAARYAFIYMVAFGCGVAVLKDEFVFVEFLKDALEMAKKRTINKIIRLLVTVAMLVISIYILTQSVPTFAFIKFRMVSTAMQIPMQYIYFSQVLLFVFLSVSLVFRIIQMLLDWNKGPAKDSSAPESAE